MTNEFLREAAEAMRRDHGPEHPRHTMWQAIAAMLENVRCAFNCDEHGMRLPHCSRCEDSTDDHECPGRVLCTHSTQYRIALEGAGAYLEAKEKA